MACAAAMRRLLPLAFWAAIVIAFVMAVLPRPPRLPGDPSDKAQHILAFAVLTALAVASWPKASRWRILLGLSGFGVLIELVQAIPALHRSADWRDWIADTAAILVLLTCVAALDRVGRGPQASAAPRNGISRRQ